jgi:transglutaminase-like putative cysteine protease
VNIPEIYAKQDAFTDPGAFAGLYCDLPDAPAELRDIVSRLIIHVAWATRYGVPPDIPLPRETLPASERLKLVGSLAGDRRERRSFGTCRDYAIMFGSMLRHQSIPARIRCGFATYFTAGPFEDHWICEYWSARDHRWVRADAQLDQLHREQLGIRFDAADLPAAVFLTAGQAWQRARSGRADAAAFGQGDARGLWFLRVNVYRDLLALTNQYTSAWDTWRNATDSSKVLDASALAAVDAAATMIAEFDVGAAPFASLTEIAAGLPPWQS